jgi:hypothetical protein
MGILQLIGAAVPWKGIGVGAGALAICGAVLLFFAQTKRIEHLDEERAAAVVSAASASRLLQIQIEENARIGAALDAADRAKTIARKAAESQRRKIFNASPNEDGPLAAVLRRQLDELPERSTADFDSGTATLGPHGTLDGK